MENKDENEKEKNSKIEGNELEKAQEKKKDEEKEEKIIHTVETKNKENPLSRNAENNNEIIEKEEEKNNKTEQKKSEETKAESSNSNNNNQINNKINSEDKLKLEKFFEDNLTKMISTWENDREGFGYYYQKELHIFLYKMLEYPCIINFQEIISHSFN